MTTTLVFALKFAAGFVVGLAMFQIFFGEKR